MTESTSNSIHSASGPFLGYLVQLVTVLHWLSMGNVHFVGLETEDDVVASILNDNSDHLNILEQVKNSTTGNAPYSNKSIDLWKTLAIWVTRITEGKVHLDSTTFNLVCNVTLPTSRLIKKIVDLRIDSNYEDQFEVLFQQLLSIAKKPSKSIKDYCSLVSQCPEETLRMILKRIRISYSDKDITEKQNREFVRVNLGISDTLPMDFIYNDLRGFLLYQVITQWRMGKEFYIERETLLRYSNILIAQHTSKTFYERTIDLLPLSKHEVDRNKGKLYVEQLRATGADEEDTFEAINDYLRASIEKGRYAKDGNLTNTDFELYYEDLRRHWLIVFKSKSKFLKGTTEDTIIGNQIFADVIQYKGKLKGQEPDQRYTYSGAYHHMANRPTIGWVPDWENKFQK